MLCVFGGFGARFTRYFKITTLLPSISDNQLSPFLSDGQDQNEISASVMRLT
jgi:hypothetical protein